VTPRDSIPQEFNQLSGNVVEATFAVHSQLGPGLLERVYQTCLVHELRKRDIFFEQQVWWPIHYDGLRLDAGLRIDLWIDRRVIVELKSVESLLRVHQAQMLTYLKLTGNRLGLLINFNVPVIRDGIKRVVL